eukprot:359188-Chlamydomonas_euryale.AAC.20
MPCQRLPALLPWLPDWLVDGHTLHATCAANSADAPTARPTAAIFRVRTRRAAASRTMRSSR